MNVNGERREIEYVLDYGLPFLVAYYHSVFRLASASEHEIAATKRLFDLVYELALQIVATPSATIGHVRGQRRRNYNQDYKQWGQVNCTPEQIDQVRKTTLFRVTKCLNAMNRC